MSVLFEACLSMNSLSGCGLGRWSLRNVYVGVAQMGDIWVVFCVGLTFCVCVV